MALLVASQKEGEILEFNYFSLILDNEIDKKYLIESNNEYETLPASEEIFQNQIQILNTEITAKKFEQQKAEFRLKGSMEHTV